MGRFSNICKHVNTVVILVVALFFFLIPGCILVCELPDPHLREPGIPKIAWRVHRKLSPRYERWARRRIASGRAGRLALHNVPSTEWPLHGSVFFLWATEALQKAWEADNSLATKAPKEYAKDAIEAAVDLVMDPVHHTWVKEHWGENYMHTNNVYFRSLLIAALTSHYNLTGNDKHLPMLRDQAETLSADLDASRHGVLEDYPFECYPIDVFAAIAWIRRADQVLGTDHSEFARRAIRAFQGRMLDERGLIPYIVDHRTGALLGPSRGVGMSHVCIFAPELYPQQAETWYSLYEEQFWQERMTAAGFREFPKDLPDRDWLYDVDAGPVINGFGPTANAFGVAAARANGRFDHAWTLSAQILAACWPLPDGTLLGPRILSSAVDAPYLGEAAILSFLTQQPVEGMTITTGGRVPLLVYLALVFFYFGIGLLLTLSAIRSLQQWLRRASSIVIPAERLQLVIWSGLLLAGLILIATGNFGIGVIVMLMSQFSPRWRQIKAADPHE